jgi:DNA helicase-2/ATP-dependent DNA helicase PcrA
MALEPPNISAEDRLVAGDVEEDRLVLSTIHSAKGWSGIRSSSSGPRRPVSSLYAMSRDDDMEEELRLMYVAATRAQENLFLYPRQVSPQPRDRLNRPSRFVDMIPGHLEALGEILMVRSQFLAVCGSWTRSADILEKRSVSIGRRSAQIA